MLNLLTEYERQLVTDPQILLAKNRIILLVIDLFGKVSEKYQKIVIDNPSFNSALKSAKVSRGENYLGLPYVMLDYPREFTKENVFAIRSFFWWGNFFSITLHLSGKYLQHYYQTFQQAFAENIFNEWYVGVAEDEWQHHFGEENYQPIELNKKYNLNEKPFLKLSTKIPVSDWDDADIFFEEKFLFLIETLTTMRRFDETNLSPGIPTTGFGL